MTSEYVIPVSNVMTNVTLRIRLSGVKVLRARLWLAAHVLRLGALIGGTAVLITVDTK